MTNQELVQVVCREIRAEHHQTYLPFTLEDGEPGLLDSKVGGVPYLPRDMVWPRDREGNPLDFLAQVDCAKLAALPDLPHTGLLQFFIGTNELYGSGFGDMAREEKAVLWHTETDPTVTAAEVEAKRPPAPEERYSPLEGGPCAIRFGDPAEQGMTSGDFRFGPLFVEKWNRENPGQPIKSFWDVFELLPEAEDDEDEEAMDRLFEEDQGEEETPRHQVGGYPYFTQSDPRERENEDLDTLLFQLDTDALEAGRGQWRVLWGDCGVANFFLRGEALKNRDFSRVMYNWDCC